MKSRSILITGSSGFLGKSLVALAPHDITLHLIQYRTPIAISRPNTYIYSLDLADKAAVTELFMRLRPGLVIHAAAASSTSTSERLESAIVRATENIVSACQDLGAYLIHISSDTVFDGEHAPYNESDALAPISPYGQAKAAAETIVRCLPGEQACIARTSLIVGTRPLDSRSEWVVKSIQADHPITLFVDELRCPVWVEDVAASIWELAAMGTWVPVIHIAGCEVLSRYALGLLIANYAGVSGKAIIGGYSRSQPQPRPRDLRLNVQLATRLLSRRPRLISELFGPDLPLVLEYGNGVAHLLQH